MRETLTMKQDELEKSKMTAEELMKEESKLRENVHKVEELEEKIIKETAALKDKLRQMENDMKVLSDLDSLRENAKAKHDNLTAEREALLQKKVSLPRLHMYPLKNYLINSYSYNFQKIKYLSYKHAIKI